MHKERVYTRGPEPAVQALKFYKLGLIQGEVEGLGLIVNTAADRVERQLVGYRRCDLGECATGIDFEFALDIFAVNCNFHFIEAFSTSRSISCEGLSACILSSIFARA